MATIKSYTDIEQSKKLAEILPLESADMCYLPTHLNNEHHWIASLSSYSECTKMTDVSIDYCIPCWSLASLIGVLPEKYTELIKEGGLYRIVIKDSYMTSLFYNPVDACVTMIIRLHELNLL